MVDPFRAAQNFFGGAAQSIGDVPVSFLDLFGQDEIARKWERKIAETFPAEPGAASFIGQVAGSLLPTLPAVWLQGAGLATKLPQLYRAARVGGLGVYGAQSAGQGRRDVRRFEEETGEDVSPAEEALTALGYGALTLATESYGMQNILGNIGDIDRRSMALLGKHISKGNVRGGARHLLNLSRRAALASTEEGLQELTEQTSQDLLSKLVYDTDRNVLENAGQAFLGGMIGGGIAHGIGMAATRWDSRHKDFFDGRGTWKMYTRRAKVESHGLDAEEALEISGTVTSSMSDAINKSLILGEDAAVSSVDVSLDDMLNPLDIVDVSRAWPVLKRKMTEFELGGMPETPADYVAKMRKNLDSGKEDVGKSIALANNLGMDDGLPSVGFKGVMYTDSGIPKVAIFDKSAIKDYSYLGALYPEDPVEFMSRRFVGMFHRAPGNDPLNLSDIDRRAGGIVLRSSSKAWTEPVDPGEMFYVEGEPPSLEDYREMRKEHEERLEREGVTIEPGVSNEPSAFTNENMYELGVDRSTLFSPFSEDDVSRVWALVEPKAMAGTKTPGEFSTMVRRILVGGDKAGTWKILRNFYSNGKLIARLKALGYKGYTAGDKFGAGISAVVWDRSALFKGPVHDLMDVGGVTTRLYQTAQQPPSRLHPQLAGKSREEASKFLSSLSSREVSKIAKDLRIGAVRGGKEYAIKLILWDQYDAGADLSRIRGYQTAQQPPRFTFRSTQVLTDPKTQRRANGQQWAGLLKKLGVTKEEMQWTGLGAELERGKQNFYTKEDLLGIVAAKGMTLAQQHQIWMTEEAYKPGERVVAVANEKPQVSSVHSRVSGQHETSSWTSGVREAETRSDPFEALNERLNVIERAWNGEFIAGTDPVTGSDYDRDFFSTMDSETWNFIPVPKVAGTGEVSGKDNRFSVTVKIKRGNMVGGKVPVLVETKITRAPKGAYGLPPRNLLTFGDLERVISNDVTMTGRDSIERAKKLVEDDFSKNPTNVLLPQRVGNLEIERDQSRTFTHVFPGKITNAFIMAVTLDPATHGMMFQVDPYHGMGGRKNQIGYVRVTERLDEDGNRHLVVEEIQSNWYTQMSVLKSVIGKLERKGYRLDKLEEHIDDMEDRVQSLSAEEEADLAMMERLKDQLTEIGFESRMFSMEDLRIYAQGDKVTQDYKNTLEDLRTRIVAMMERGRNAGTPEGKRLENIATSLLINTKTPGSQYNPTADDLSAAIGVLDRASQRVTNQDTLNELDLLKRGINIAVPLAPTRGGRHVAGYRLPPVPENPFGDNWYKHVVKNLVAQLSKQGYRSIYFTHDDFQKAYQHMDNVKTLDMYRKGLGEFLTKYAEDWGGVYTPDAAFMVDTEAQPQFRPVSDPALPEEKNALRKFAQILRKGSKVEQVSKAKRIESYEKAYSERNQEIEQRIKELTAELNELKEKRRREGKLKLRDSLEVIHIEREIRSLSRSYVGASYEEANAAIYRSIPIEDRIDVSEKAQVKRALEGVGESIEKELEQMWQTQTHEPPWGPDDDYSRAKGSGWATTSGLSDPTVRAIRNLNVVKLSHLFIKESMAEKLEAEEQLFFQTQGREPMMSNEQRDLFADHLRNSGLVAQVVVSPTPLTKPDGTEVNAYAELIPGTANSFRIVLGPRIQTNTAGHELFEVFAALLPENDPMLARGRRIMESLGFRDSPGLPGHWKEALADVVGRVYYQRKMRAGIYQRVVGWLQDFWTHVKNWARVQLSAEDIARLLNERMAQGVGGVVGGRIPNADWLPTDEVVKKELSELGIVPVAGEAPEQQLQRLVGTAEKLQEEIKRNRNGAWNANKVHKEWNDKALALSPAERGKAIARVLQADPSTPIDPVDVAVYMQIVEASEKRMLQRMAREKDTVLREQYFESLRRAIEWSGQGFIHPATRMSWGLSYFQEERTVANILKSITELKGRLSAEELHRLYQALASGDPQAVQQVSQQLSAKKNDPTVGDQIYALYYNSLLSGPPAHLVNTTTNFLWQSWNYGHTALEGFLDAIGSTITGKPRQVFVGDVLPRFVGAKRGLPMARKLAGVIWREGSVDKLSEQIEIVRNFDIFGTATVQQADAAIVEIAKILKVPQSEVRSRGFLNAVKAMTEDKFHIEMGTASVTALERGMLKNFPKLAQMITAPSRFMRLADVFAKTLAMDGRMTELLYKKLGSLDAAEKFLKKSYQSMSESEKRMYAEVLEEASYYADLMTFTDRPPRWVKGLIDARNAIPGAKLLIPFITTVTNIARRGLEMTPGLGLYKLGTKEFREGFKRRIEIVDPLGHKTHDKVFVGKGRLTDVLAKQIEGSIIMGLLMWLFDEDRVTAGVPVNPVKREQFYAEGKLPWSIRVGDTWVQYKRWEPFATIFGFVGSVYDALQQASTVEEGTGVFQAAASNFTQYLLDNTFVGGVRDLMTTHSVSDELARVPVGFVPYSSMWSWMKRGIDAWEGKRPLFEKPEDFLGKVKENLRQVDVPGLMEEPPRRLNVWGEEVSIPGGILAQWLPWKFSQADTDPTEAELARLGVYPGPPQNKLTINRREVELPEDLHRQYLLWFGAKAKSEIDRLFRSSRYQGQEKEERKLWMLEGVVRRARELARQRVIREVVRQRRDLLGRGARVAQPATTSVQTGI